jgi:hypothetical protein
MARKFFYVCAGMLMLALSFHFGFTTASAQAPGNPVVAMPVPDIAVTANGDLYQGTNPSGNAPTTWTWKANIFSGSAPVQTQRATWGQVKARYAPNPSTAAPGADAK